MAALRLLVTGSLSIEPMDSSASTALDQPAVSTLWKRGSPMIPTQVREQKRHSAPAIDRNRIDELVPRDLEPSQCWVRLIEAFAYGPNALQHRVFRELPHVFYVPQTELCAFEHLCYAGEAKRRDPQE